MVSTKDCLTLMKEEECKEISILTTKCQHINIGTFTTTYDNVKNSTSTWLENLHRLYFNLHLHTRMPKYIWKHWTQHQCESGINQKTSSKPEHKHVDTQLPCLQGRFSKQTLLWLNQDLSQRQCILSLLVEVYLKTVYRLQPCWAVSPLVLPLLPPLLGEDECETLWKLG